jgi:aryl-alcohol dehydrogenase-like predicted oxidoreductase
VVLLLQRAPAGKAIKGCREKFIVATKCGIVKTDSGLIFDGSRKHVREACEASLKRLGTDYIDLFYLHRCALRLGCGFWVEILSSD